MTDISYYKDYNGPNLTKATLDKDDITEAIKNIYGEDNNWNGKLWSYEEVFGNDCENKSIYCDFHSKEGRKHWFHGFIQDKKQFFNPPLATPMDQNNNI